jgi:hypothetical protein
MNNSELRTVAKKPWPPNSVRLLLQGGAEFLVLDGGFCDRSLQDDAGGDGGAAAAAAEAAAEAADAERAAAADPMFSFNLEQLKMQLAPDFEPEGEWLRKHSWLRMPAGSSFAATAGACGAKVWVKTGHLLHVHVPDQG